MVQWGAPPWKRPMENEEGAGVLARPIMAGPITNKPG